MKINKAGAVQRLLAHIHAFILRMHVARSAKQTEAELGFMTGTHRTVHHYVVRELPRLGRPMPPDNIARDLELPLERVVHILDDLEAHMTFLFRNGAGAVVWAYPVTVEETPHRITFSSGEKLYAA